MNNIRKYKEYVIKRTTIHTTRGGCYPNYEIYKDNGSDIYIDGRLHCEEKLKDAKLWVDRELFIGKRVKINNNYGKITKQQWNLLYVILESEEKTYIDYKDVDKYLVLE